MQKLILTLIVVAAASGACATEEPGTLQAATEALGANELRVDRVFGNRQVVPVRPGAEPDAALAGVRCQQLHGEHQLRDACRTRADGAHPGGRAESRAARSRYSSARCRSSAARTRGTWRRPRAPRRAPPRRRSRSRRPSKSGRWRSGRRRMGSSRRRPRTTPRRSRPRADPRCRSPSGGKYRYVGRINAQNQVERVQTWIDNPCSATRRSRSPTPTTATSTA